MSAVDAALQALREQLAEADRLRALADERLTESDRDTYDALADALGVLREAVLVAVEVADEATLIDRLDAAALLAAGRAASGFVKWAEALPGVIAARERAESLPTDREAEIRADEFRKGHQAGERAAQDEALSHRHFLTGLAQEIGRSDNPTSARLVDRIREQLEEPV